MKCYFIFNPYSGIKKHDTSVLKAIRDACKKADCEYDVYFTKETGDAASFCKRVCTENADNDKDNLRFYGFGGDGTLNELVNGCYGYPEVEIGIIPRGTGNDYIRNYEDPYFFTSIEAQVNGLSRVSDLIRYTAEYEGETIVGYCANMFNIGFDCNVVDMTEKAKNWPLVRGSSAYLISILIMLAEKKTIKLRIEYENGDIREEEVLQVSIGNGCYCGGGIKGLPRANLNDGLMDVSVVRNISRSLFLSLFPSYSKGNHLDNSRLIKNNVVDYRQERRLKISACDESLMLCTDGELSIHKTIEFEMVKDAFRFICQW